MNGRGAQPPASGANPVGSSVEVLLVGAGTGDPDLLTLDAEHALTQADVVVADRCLGPLVDALVDEGVMPALRLGGGEPPVGAASGGPSVRWVADQDAASSLLPVLVAEFPEGTAAPRGGPWRLVRLYRGDPWLHPAGDDERASLRATGIGFQVVPGVIDEAALAAAAGIPLQVRQLSVTTTFATDAACVAGPSAPVLDPREEEPHCASAGQSGAEPGLVLPRDPAHTLVVRTADLSATARRLVEAGDPAGPDPFALDRPAAAIPAGAGAGAGVVQRGTLADLAAGASTVAGVLVVGPVAALDFTATGPAARGEHAAEVAAR